MASAIPAEDVDLYAVVSVSGNVSSGRAGAIAALRYERAFPIENDTAPASYAPTAVPPVDELATVAPTGRKAA